MTDMNLQKVLRFGPRFMLATVLATFAAFAIAQDAVDDFFVE